MQPTAKWKQHQIHETVNVSLRPLISGKATSQCCKERRGARAASPRQRSRALHCHGVRSWALCRLQTLGCQSSSREAGSPDARSATLGGPPLWCLCGLPCLWALQRHISWKNCTWVVTLTWQVPFQALYKGVCASTRHSSAEVGCHGGKWGWSPAMAWAARLMLAEHFPGGPEMPPPGRFTQSWEITLPKGQVTYMTWSFLGPQSWMISPCQLHPWRLKHQLSHLERLIVPHSSMSSGNPRLLWGHTALKQHGLSLQQNPDPLEYPPPTALSYPMAEKLPTV